MSMYLCAQRHAISLRRQLTANETALARARTAAGLKTSVLADVAQLMEGNTLGSGDPGPHARSAHYLLPQALCCPQEGLAAKTLDPGSDCH